MRYAIYFTPPHDDPLHTVASNWLGRDAFSGRSVEAPAIRASSPPRSLFHTACAAPLRVSRARSRRRFRWQTGDRERASGRADAHSPSTIDPVDIPRLSVGSIGPFFALVPQTPMCRRSMQLASDVVVAFDTFRAPLCGSRNRAAQIPHSLDARRN